MPIAINVSVDLEDAQRKRAVGMTWRELILLGLKTAEENEKEPDEDK